MIELCSYIPLFIALAVIAWTAFVLIRDRIAVNAALTASRLREIEKENEDWAKHIQEAEYKMEAALEKDTRVEARRASFKAAKDRLELVRNSK